MPKSLTARYYQENKERLLKNLVKDIKFFLKKNFALMFEKFFLNK